MRIREKQEYLRQMLLAGGDKSQKLVFLQNCLFDNSYLSAQMDYVTSCLQENGCVVLQGALYNNLSE